MRSGQRLLPLLLGTVLLATAAVADRSLVGQADAQAQVAAARADGEARAAADAFEAALRQLELPGGPRPPGVRLERLAIPPSPGLAPQHFVPYLSRSRAELTALLSSTRATATGLPEAAVARLALGPTAISGAAESARQVEQRLLSGQLPVRAADLPLIADRLGVGDDPRVAALASRLRAAPPAVELPEFPAHRHRLLDDTRIEGWSRSASGWLQRCEVPVALPLAAAGVPGRTVAAAWAMRTLPGAARVVAVSQVPGLFLRVEVLGPARLRLSALRVVLWAASAAGVLAVAALQRARRRETRAARRERAFLAGVTHELRTPVTAIRVLGETLADGRGNACEYGELVAREAERLEGLVEQVLTATRVERVPRFGPVAPAELLSNAIALVAAGARRRGTTVEARLPDSLPECRWDADAVRRALLNLLDNAIVHGREGGHVRVGAEVEGVTVRLSVADDGPGVGRSERRRIFGRFERGNTEAAGTGLGLFLVEEVARAHGGRVDLVSAEGEGATFSMLLPIDPNSAATALGGPGGAP